MNEEKKERKMKEEGRTKRKKRKKERKKVQGVLERTNPPTFLSPTLFNTLHILYRHDIAKITKFYTQ
jgi:uncharacterized protein (UPF0218 family)